MKLRLTQTDLTKAGITDMTPKAANNLYISQIQALNKEHGYIFTCNNGQCSKVGKEGKKK